jgi:ubiquinone/menaquinone biosynthesis C-methylase UbiE
MKLKEYRNTESEQVRINSLISLIPKCCKTILDIGARDGYFSNLFANYFKKITALDLFELKIKNPQIDCVQGDVVFLSFKERSFDVVFCSEVLEHIPKEMLEKACFEIIRVAKKYVLIGVPYKQDTRIGRTTCRSCGKINPPWGHINAFDEKKIINLFVGLKIAKIEFVGLNKYVTNFLSTYLFDISGNPWGTYDQEEKCIFCNSKIIYSKKRNILHKIFCKIAILLNKLQGLYCRNHPNWVHILFEKD